MSEHIAWEWGYFLTSMMWGMVLAVCYDCIRVFRRIVRHRSVIWIAAEDIVYWMCCGFVIFHVTFMVNDGIVRSFSIAGFVIGAVMYRYATNNWLVNKVAAILNILMKPLKILCKYIRILINKIYRRVTAHEKIRDKAGTSGTSSKTKTL